MSIYYLFHLWIYSLGIYDNIIYRIQITYYIINDGTKYIWNASWWSWSSWRSLWQQDLVLLPPPNYQYTSDKEVGDDDIGLTGNIDLPTDVTGVVEVHCANVDSDDGDDSD